jgi:hypothetical protein
VGLIALVLVTALVAGLLAGGRLARLAALRTRRPGLAAAALAGVLLTLCAAAAGARGSAWYLVPAAWTAACAAAFLAGNRRLPGAPLLAGGLAANLLAIAANGAMPVSRLAAARAGLSLRGLAAGTDPGHVLAGAGSALRPLGDVIPFPLPGWPEVLSPGDLLIAAGLGLLLYTALGPAPLRRLGGQPRPTARRRPARQFPAGTVGHPAGRPRPAPVAWPVTLRRTEEPAWPNEPASAGPAPGGRPTTASDPTPDPQRRARPTRW